MRERTADTPDLALELLRLGDRHLLGLRGAVAAASAIAGWTLDVEHVADKWPDEHEGLAWALTQAKQAVDALEADLDRVRELAKAAAA